MADTTGKISSIKAELRAATQEAQALGLELAKMRDSANGLDPAKIANLESQFTSATEKAAQLRDQINDTNEQIGVLTAGSKFEVLGNGIKDVAGKIASLDFEGAAESANRLVQLSKNINFGDAVKGVKDIGTTFVQLGKALLTNPLFLIAGAIALAVTYADELFSLIDGVSGKDEERLATLTEQAAASKEQLDSISAQEERLKANGMSEEEILQLKIDQAKVAAADALAQLEQQKTIRDNQIAAAERNKKILSGILQFVTISLQALLYGIDELTLKLKEYGVISEETYATVGNLRDRFNEGVSSLVFDPEQVKEEGDAAVKEAEKNYIALDNQLAGFQNRQKANRQKAAADRKAEADKEAEENRKRLEKEAADRIALEKRTQDAIRNANNERLNEEEALAEEIYQAGLSAQEREIIALQDAYFQKIELAKQYGLDVTNLEAEQAAKIAEINKQYADENLQIQLDANAQLKSAEENLQAAKINAVSTGFDVLNTLFKGNEKAQKAFFIAQKGFEAGQVIVKGIAANAEFVKAAAVATANAAANPALLAVLPAQLAAIAKSAAANKISTAASVAAIAATTFGNLSAGGGGSTPPTAGGTGPTPNVTGFGSSSAPATPAFNLFGQNNNANTLNAAGQPVGGQPQPLAIQVSVSETEITQTQNFVRRVSESAVL